MRGGTRRGTDNEFVIIGEQGALGLAGVVF